ncbi:MAG: hypothetical protein IIA92_07525 [Chloroflexi bacterium]|nr:hypothetical protein [Chloroflexota bacterium]
MTAGLRENLLSACNEVGLTEADADRIFKELSSLVKVDDSSVYFHIASGPLPSFPETILDIWLLSNRTLYNYDVRKQTGGAWAIMPLNQIAYIQEDKPVGDPPDWNSALIYGVSGINALTIQDKIANWDGLLRNFLARLIEST